MMYKFLIIILIIVPGIYYSLASSYFNYFGLPYSSHRYISPIYPSYFDFTGITNMKSPEVKN